MRHFCGPAEWGLKLKFERKRQPSEGKLKILKSYREIGDYDIGPNGIV
jgi:hypothetical protein